MRSRILVAILALGAPTIDAPAALPPCTNADALGTERVLAVDTGQWRDFGKNSRWPMLPLEKHEYVLTFDDGPSPETTEKNLAILRQQCVRATFFMIGNRAAKWPDLVQAIAADGHTLASHSWDHRNLAEIPFDDAVQDIVKGYSAVEEAVYRAVRSDGMPRFFRFPYESQNQQLLDWTFAHHIAVAGVDITPSSRPGETPDATLARLEARMAMRGRGVILLHEGSMNNTLFLPNLLAYMKASDLKVVQIVPK